MANPFAVYAQPQSGGVFITDPTKTAAQRRADEDQRLQREAAVRAAEAADRQAAASNRQADAQERTATNQSYDNVMKLRSAYEATPIVKEYRVGITQLGAALQRPADATGDNALIYDYAKAMDPGSVVRESEMGMAASGAPAYEAFAANLKKQFKIEGGGQLTPETRAKLKREIATKVGAMNKQYSAQRIRYANDAKAAGIDPRNVTGDHDGDVFMPQIKAFQEQQGGKAPAASVASGSTRRVYDERLESKIDSLISAGKFETANIALRKAGKAPISATERTKIEQWQKKNPGVAYNASQFGRDVPTNLLQRAAGSDVGAGVARAANAATAGLVGLASGSKGQGALDAMAANSPNASVAGDVVGGVFGALGGEAAIAGRLAGRGPAWLAPVLGDAGFGGLSGFNAAQEGEGLKGAALGSGAGVLGGRLGAGVANQAGRLVRGVRNPAVHLLRERGVPLTVGQTVGDSGRAGAAVRNVENALTSIPGVNGVVNARYREGLEGFNRAAFGELPGHSGETGAAGIVEAGGLVDNAYRFLDNTNLPVDAPFAGGQAAVRAELPTLPAFGPQVGVGMDAIDASAARAGGALPGRDWQSAVRSNRANRSSVAGQPYSDHAVNLHNDIEDNLLGLAQRQGPAGTEQALGEANVLNGQYQTLLRALDNGPAQQADELVTPSRLDAASRQGANAFGGRAASIGGDRPFYDLTTAGRSVLPSTVPDSGTATRGIVAASLVGGLGGSAAGAPFGESSTAGAGGLGAALLLAAGGSRNGQRILTSALLDRPDLAVQLGQAISRNARLGGVAGASALTPLAIGQ